MTNWTYRVSKQTLKNGDVVFAIREFYPSEVTKELNSWTADEIAPTGDSIDGLRWALNRMIEACDKEVVDLHYEGYGEGDMPEHERLIAESIKTLEWLRSDLESKDLNGLAKTMIVKGTLNNLGENDE